MNPGGTGRPAAAMLLRQAPFPPAMVVAPTAGAPNPAAKDMRAPTPPISILDNCHRSHGRRGSVDPFYGEHAQPKSVRRKLLEVGHVLEVVILAPQHHPVRLPELFALEHRPDGRVERDGVD